MPTPTSLVRSPPSTFIGRGGELRALLAWFQSSASRLLTVLGPPGVGKTRLVQRFAQDVGTATFCDLTQAHDPGLPLILSRRASWTAAT